MKEESIVGKKIYAIHKLSAHYNSRKKIIGTIVTHAKLDKSSFKGWRAGKFTTDNRTGEYYCAGFKVTNK